MTRSDAIVQLRRAIVDLAKMHSELSERADLMTKLDVEDLDDLPTIEKIDDVLRTIPNIDDTPRRDSLDKARFALRILLRKE